MGPQTEALAIAPKGFLASPSAKNAAKGPADSGATSARSRAPTEGNKTGR